MGVECQGILRWNGPVALRHEHYVRLAVPYGYLAASRVDHIGLFGILDG